LYYGLSSVPYSLLDGGSKEQHRFDYDQEPLSEGTIGIRLLADAQFMIAPSASVVGNSLHVGADVTALKEVPSSELTLHIAVTENRIEGIEGGNGETVFHNVVKTMLPDAGGTTFYQEWDTGETQHVNFTWDMEHIYNLEELEVVAFIQEEETKEIYQSARHAVFVQTGTVEHLDKPQDIPIFWVSADPVFMQATIRFKEPLTRGIKLELYNSQGILVFAGNIRSGNLQMKFSYAAFPDGIYLIRLADSHQWTGTAKVVLTR
jgi:hypothetical protein